MLRLNRGICPRIFRGYLIVHGEHTPRASLDPFSSMEAGRVGDDEISRGTEEFPQCIFPIESFNFLFGPSIFGIPASEAFFVASSHISEWPGGRVHWGEIHKKLDKASLVLVTMKQKCLGSREIGDFAFS